MTPPAAPPPAGPPPERRRRRRRRPKARPPEEAEPPRLGPTRDSVSTQPRPNSEPVSAVDVPPLSAGELRPMPPLRIEFPPHLPLSARVAELRTAIDAHPVVIVAGATGSGKTTQLPKVALSLGRGERGLIGITQPRRIAATSVAARVASELQCPLGGAVGYQIRFDDRTSEATRLKFMTDGILLAEMQRDRLLRRYDTLIVDEAHERSLNIDFLLGWLKRTLPLRPDLKLVISSATIETERFSQFFGGAPVVEVEGRTFPVDVLYEPPDPKLDLHEATAAAVENIASLDPEGDILVFLPGEREIRDTERALAKAALPRTAIQPLFSRLSAADQRKVFADTTERRVILATNVAETSLTLPGVVYVVDVGLARLARYDPRTGTTRLQVEPISQASANQRKGRCGRVRDGICVRLFDEQSYDSRPAFTDPEMKRVGLSGVILRMKALGLGRVEDFLFLDAPSPRSIREGYRVLEELGAIDADGELTKLGVRISRFPVDPRIAKMIVAGDDLGVLESVLVVAAALNVPDPRERPRGMEGQADQAHRAFRDARSDFASLLNLWKFLEPQRRISAGQLRRACKERYLSVPRVREWFELHRQLSELWRETGAPAQRRPSKTRGRQRDSRPATKATRSAPGEPAGNASEPDESQLDARLHQALLGGLLSRIGHYDPRAHNYAAARQSRFVLHPSSGVAKKPPQWVMAFELVQTTRLFARTAARLEPAWLESVGGHLMVRKFSEPFWSEKAARASVKEHATLFGLEVFRGRSVDYASVAPGRARLLFIEHALVRGEYQSRGAFQEHNRTVLAEAARLRDKARKGENMEESAALLEFFDERVPDSVVSGVTFERWRRTTESEDPRLLCLSLSDVLVERDGLDPGDYPDSVVIHGVRVRLSYRFDPWAQDDGVTVELPLALLPQLQAGELTGIIPGWHSQKVLALLERLPRSLRRELPEAESLSLRLASQVPPMEGQWATALRAALQEELGLEVPSGALAQHSLPPYLRLNLRVRGEREEVLDESRQLSELLERQLARALEAVQQAGASPEHADWERSGLTTWDFEALPSHVERRVAGARVRGYPAFLDSGESVRLSLLESPQAALDSSRRGLLRLFVLESQSVLRRLRAGAPPPLPSPQALPPSRVQSAAFADQVVLRAASEAFEIALSGAPQTLSLPRTRDEYQVRLGAGRRRLPESFEATCRTVRAISVGLRQAYAALSAADREPSGTRAGSHVREQLAALCPPDLLLLLPLGQLAHLPRYFDAMRSRLTRAIHDPRRDAERQAEFEPLWKLYQGACRTQPTEQTRQLSMDLEELRVALFAPDVRPAYSVRARRLRQELEALR